MPVYYVKFDYDMSKSSSQVSHGAPVEFLGTPVRSQHVTFLGPVTPLYGTSENWLLSSLPYSHAAKGTWLPNGNFEFATPEFEYFNYTIRVEDYFIQGTRAAPTVLAGDVLSASSYDDLNRYDVVVNWTDWVWAQITIPDPAPKISISDASPVKIGSPNPLFAEFTVSLNAPATSIVSVNYATKPGTALAGTDYTTRNGTITFQPGQTTATIQVPVTQHFITQDKAFTVELSNATSAVTIDDSSGQAVIDAPDYHLVFTFRQQLTSLGISYGTITAEIFNHGQLVTQLAPMTGRASVDDAFPLKNMIYYNANGGAPIASESRTFKKYPLTFDLEPFEPNPQQTAVIMHVGTFNSPVPEVSWSSQSCLVVQERFLDALQSNLSKLAGQTFTAKNVAVEAAWINSYVDVTFDVQTTLTQAVLSVDAPTIVNRTASGGINPNATFEFHLSRFIEKDVLVLYSVTDADTGATVVRSSVVPTLSTSSADIAFASLFGSAKPPKAAADALKIFSDPSGAIPLNKNTYNKSLPWNPAHTYEIEIEAYAVRYQKGKDWYFDSRASKGPADPSNQSLMFSNDLTADFTFGPQPAGPVTAAVPFREDESFRFSEFAEVAERSVPNPDYWLL